MTVSFIDKIRYNNLICVNGVSVHTQIDSAFESAHYKCRGKGTSLSVNRAEDSTGRETMMNAYTVPVDYVDLNSPVEVIGVRVEQTGQENFAFVTLRNLDRLVLQVRLSIYLFDAAGRALGAPVDAVIQNISVERLQLFGGDCLIRIGSYRPASVRVEVVGIANDNGKGVNKTRNIVPVLPPVLVAPMDIKYLHIMAGKDAVNLFSQNGPLWQCVCGRTNAETQSTCMRCRREYDVVKKYDRDGLIARRAVEQRAERVLAPPVPTRPMPPQGRSAALTASALTGETAAPKKKKISSGAVCVIILSILFLAAAAYFTYDYGLVGPGRDYKLGMTYFTQGRYGEAQGCFMDIHYKDSEKMALYAQAFDLANRGKLREAAAIFDQLGEYKDAPQLKEDYRYKQMQQSLNQNEYYDALEMMRLLEPTGRVDPGLLNSTTLKAAGEKLRGGDPATAKTLFQEISAIYSVNDQIQECDYQVAVNHQNYRQYEEAIGVFASITRYRDSASRMQECKYDWAKALSENKEYKKAVELFGELRYFRDSKDQFNETCYRAGTELVKAGDKKAAQDFFNMIPDYKDAASYVVGKQEYDYRTAVDLRNNKRYKAAAEAFLALGDYRDSAQIAVLCDDDALNEASPFTDLQAVMYKLQALGTYGDASDRLSDKKYVKIRLAGNWQDDNGNQFQFTLVGDAGYYIETELPMFSGVVNSRFNGYVYEVSVGGAEFTSQFEFISLTETEIVLYNHTDSISYSLRKR